MATEYINKIKTPDGVTRNIQDSEVPSWAKQSSKPTYTKSEVGLGNVPNVTTDNQTPTVTEATTRANLASGDTLKTIIGKIKKFFTDLKTVAFTGSYTDLSNKPTIPAAQIQSDWNQSTTTSLDYIKNKPTIPSASSAAPGKVASSSAQGSSANYARQDHTHGIDLATGDSNGQVKIAGTNVPVKGLGSAAYTASTAYAAASHTQSSDTITGGYLNIHPENSPTLIPFMNNDICYLLKRGGSAVVKYDSTTQSVDLTNCFDASPSYWAINPTGVTTITIELTLHKTFTWSNTVYVDFGASGWRAKTVKFEVMNTAYSGDTWTQKYYTTTNALGHCYATFSHTPVGAANAGGGFNKLRYTFSVWQTSTIFRIAQLGIYNYGSSGLRETFLPRDGGYLLGSLLPSANNTYDLGSSSQVWKNVYATTFTGALSGNATSATSATSATTASKLGSSTVGGTTTPIYLNGGTPTALGYTIAKSVPSNAVFTDASVTASGNHYTPATASGQDKTASATGGTAAWSMDVVKGVTLSTDGKGHVTAVSVTSGKVPANPVPSNNVTGSGTNNYLTKFSGANTITNGPAIGSAVSTQTQTTKFLREDGTWAAPSYTVNTDEKVTQVNDSSNANRRIILGDGSDNDTRTANVKKSSYFTFNPSTHNLYLGGSINGYTVPSGIDAASTSIASAFSKVSQSSMPYLTLTLEKPMFSALDNLLCLTFLLTNTNSSDVPNSGFLIQAEDADLPLVSFNNTTLKNLIGREIIDAVCVFGGVNRALNGSRGDAPFIYNVVHDKTNNYLKPILSYSNKPTSTNFYLDTSTKTKYKSLRFTMLFNLSKA